MEVLHESASPLKALHGHAHRRVSRHRASLACGALLFATAICVTMVLMRRLYVGYASYAFLIWNLTLAWIPLLFSFATYRFHVLGIHRRFLVPACAVAWFLFFPNAPYMVTDFVHLSPIHLAPEWLDVITIISCAWTGLCLGFLSLYLMQEIVRAYYGKLVCWLFVLVMLALGSVGVFCGRFLRWNSWDVVRHPLRILHRGAYTMHAFSQPGDIMFLMTLSLFLLLSYVVLFSLAHLYDRAGS